MTMSPEAELGYKLQQAQAENERLTQRRDLARKLVLLCAAERRQAQARVKRLEEAIKEVLEHLPNRRYLRTQGMIKRILEAALAEGDTQ